MRARSSDPVINSKSETNTFPSDRHNPFSFPSLSLQLVFLGCLACGFLLHFAPEEPSEDVNGGIYTFVPTIVLLGAALSMVICLVLGCYGVCKDSKLALILVWRIVAGYRKAP